MRAIKPAGKFGGRPVEREPEPGKRAHLSAAIPLSLKRKVEQAAKKRGWSVSSETAHRLEMSFSNDVMTDAMRDALKEEFLGWFGNRPRGPRKPGDLGLLNPSKEPKK